MKPSDVERTEMHRFALAHPLRVPEDLTHEHGKILDLGSRLVHVMLSVDDAIGYGGLLWRMGQDLDTSDDLYWHAGASLRRHAECDPVPVAEWAERDRWTVDRALLQVLGAAGRPGTRRWADGEDLVHLFARLTDEETFRVYGQGPRSLTP